MRSRLLISVSAAALIAGAGFATAQDRGGPSAAPQSSSPAQQSAPPAAKSGAGERGTTGQGGQMEQRDQRMPDPGNRAQQDRGDQKQQRAQDRKGGAEQGTTGQGGQDQRGQQQRGQEPRAQDQRNQQRQDRVQDNKKGDRNTTGQGAAGAGSASLTSEQRTKISTTIRQSNVKRETNVNFNVSVGTVVPRTVSLHVLPPAVIEVYPQWRGYRFVLVEDEIIIIEPSTYRIVAVIDA
jgi:hypothetical protein